MNVAQKVLLSLCLGGLGFAQTYTVKPGDTLWGISRKTGIRVSALQQLNGLSSDRIQPGMVLRVGNQPVLRAAVYQQGRAAWYGPGFHGGKTASGELFNTYTLTAAHRSLPFGTLVRVTNLRNGRQVVVRINDRGPYSRGYIIDLSYVAAKRLRMTAQGTASVTLEVLR